MIVLVALEAAVIVVLSVALLVSMKHLMTSKKVNRNLAKELIEFKEIKEHQKTLSELNNFRRAIQTFSGGVIEVRTLDQDMIFYREPTS